MPYFIRLEEHEDLVWLTAMVQGRLGRYRDNISAYVEEAIKAERVASSLGEVKEADSATLHKTHAVVTTKTKRIKTAEVVTAPKLCETHPLYGAKRAPRTDCSGCWLAYEKYNGRSKTTLARNKFIRNGKT